MIPDGEAVVIDFLTTALPSERVGTSLPNDLSGPWVRVNLIDAPAEARSTVDHLVTYHLQFDCYGGEGRNQRPQANDLARRVRLLIATEIVGVHGEAVVTGSRIMGMHALPDDSETPTRERYIVEAYIWMHS